MTTMAIPRRTILRATGTSLALPFLPSLGWKAFAAEQPIAPPKRMVFLSFGWGVTNETWFPDKTNTGADYPLSEGLAPLDRHKSRITVIQGLSNKFANEAHWGSTFYLTGANRYAVPGSSFSNSISADQVAAEKFGKHTRFTSLQLTSKDAEQSGHGPGLSLAWNRQGKPLAGVDTPLAAYEKLFGDEKTPLADRERMLKEQRSVLDAVLAQAQSIDKTLSKRDKEKLDEYFQSIREIETRLAKEESWMTTPKPKAPLAAPGESLVGEQEIKLMYDLLVAAFQTDSTRVVTYRQPMANLIKSMGITVAPHDLSHYTPGDRTEASKQRDKKQSELLAHLLDKLEAVKEADGSSLLDNVCLAYGSNIRSIHYLDNCPTVIAGGGAGVKHGRHVMLEAKQTPLANLWLTLLQGVGIEADSFGDSTGALPSLTS
jgi:DNA-binding transcriptional MerR regulator